MNIVLVIPTGIGAEIGGHAGDGNPVARLMASCCDNLITHPNVVNASDINEMTENTLYVEGSMLDSFLDGGIGLKKVKSNKVLVVVNSPVKPETINGVSAARATIGLDAFIVELDKPLEMIATMENGKATGEVHGYIELAKQVDQYSFDALAIITPITVEVPVALDYLTKGGVNPWGGVEAKASKLVAALIDRPVAHAPMGNILENFKEVVDPRMAPEVVSINYLHCVLKGLHKAPQPTYDPPSIRGGEELSVSDVDVLVSPMDCWGPPHKACHERGIPVIMVKENKTVCEDPIPAEAIIAKNYLEAVGIIKAMDSGVSVESVRRPGLRFPLPHTIVRRKDQNGI